MKMMCVAVSLGVLQYNSSLGNTEVMLDLKCGVKMLVIFSLQIYN